MLDLSTVTLLCVDSRAPDLATWAILRCLTHARFASVVLITDLSRVSVRREGIRYVQTPPLRDVRDYSRLLLTGIGEHIVGSHVLIIQWDGFILRPDLWDQAFLAYDYIGAAWPQFPQTPVGNGGFSLRSRRLVDAMSDPGIVICHPEDKCICITNRRYLEERHAIRFAPTEVAERFSVERTAWHPAFGFHGFFNFVHVLEPGTLAAFIDEIPESCCTGLDSFHLIHELVRHGLDAEARRLFSKCRFRLRRAGAYLEAWRAVNRANGRG